MIKFIHCADFHLGIKKYGKANLETGICSRVQEDLDQLDKIINFAVKRKYKLFLIAGDIFDKRKPDEIVKREFVKRVKTLLDNNIKVIILIGNHEGVIAIDTAHCLSSIRILAESKLLYIVDKAQVIDIDNISIACVPYYNNQENLLIKKPTILLGHLEVYGAKQNGYVFKKGVSPLIFNNKKLIYIALGHIHQHQQIGKAVYSGSINRINFGDEDVSKGFIKGIINNNKVNWKFVKLNSRKFLTINGIWGKGINKKIKKSNVKNKIVKVNIRDENENSIVPILSIKNYLQGHGAIVDSVNISRDVKIKVRDKKYKKYKTPKQMLKHYLKGEKKSVIKRGIKLLNEASQ